MAAVAGQFAGRNRPDYRAAMPDERAPDTDDMAVVKTSRSPEELAGRLGVWLAEITGDPSATVTDASSPDANGMSSESVFFTASFNDESGSFVARLAPADDDVPIFAEYDLDKQARVIALVAERSDVPVPSVRWNEPDPSHLDVPFFVMEKVDGRVPPDILPYPMDGWVRDLTATERRALQDKSVAVLAGIHSIDISDGSAAFLQADATLGATPLERHFAQEKAFYEWMVDSAGRRFPTIERAHAWIETNWPDEQPSAISWGDARIGNIMYAHDSTDPVSVLDWEMATIAPPGLDVAWMCFLHRFFEFVLHKYGVDTLPEMLRPEDVRETYGALTGVDVGDLRFELVYTAARHASIMARVHARSVHFGTEEWTDDPDDAFRFKELLLEMLAD